MLSAIGIVSISVGNICDMGRVHPPPSCPSAYHVFPNKGLRHISDRPYDDVMMRYGSLYGAHVQSFSLIIAPARPGTIG